jgi:hypothetical protein
LLGSSTRIESSIVPGWKQLAVGIDRPSETVTACWDGRPPPSCRAMSCWVRTLAASLGRWRSTCRPYVTDDLVPEVWITPSPAILPGKPTKPRDAPWKLRRYRSAARPPRLASGAMSIAQRVNCVAKPTLRTSTMLSPVFLIARLLAGAAVRIFLLRSNGHRLDLVLFVAWVHLPEFEGC